MWVRVMVTVRDRVRVRVRVRRCPARRRDPAWPWPQPAGRAAPRRSARGLPERVRKRCERVVVESRLEVCFYLHGLCFDSVDGGRLRVGVGGGLRSRRRGGDGVRGLGLLLLKHRDGLDRNSELLHLLERDLRVDVLLHDEVLNVRDQRGAFRGLGDPHADVGHGGQQPRATTTRQVGPTGRVLVVQVLLAVVVVLGAKVEHCVVVVEPRSDLQDRVARLLRVLQSGRGTPIRQCHLHNGGVFGLM